MEGYEEVTPEVAEAAEAVKETVTNVTSGLITLADMKKEEFIKKLSGAISDKLDKIINKAYNTKVNVSADPNNSDSGVKIDITTNDPRIIAVLASQN